jgi:hypothetical protein
MVVAMSEWTDQKRLARREVARFDIVTLTKGPGMNRSEVSGEWDVLRIQARNGQEIVEVRSRVSGKTRTVSAHRIDEARRPSPY